MTRSAFYPVLICLGAILSVGLLAAFAQNPAWWSSRGVLQTGTTANDYAAANIGQLKNIATKAAAELNAQLPGGAGSAINTLVAGWSQPAVAGVTRNDFAAVNVGQLKAVAKPFYDRLNAVGYTSFYPWTASTTDDNDYAAANLGQVKNLFSFDLRSTDAAHDVDHDGLPDWWERFYNVTNAQSVALRGHGLTNLQAWQQGLNPNDFYNGLTPVVTMVSGSGQTGPANGFVPAPLIIKVTNNAGLPLLNAPVTFSVIYGGGVVQKTNLTAASSSLTLQTDHSGQARAYYKLPNLTNASASIVAKAGIPPRQGNVVFTESTGNGTYGNPFDPSDMVANLNPDGSLDVAWTNHTDPADTEPVNIRFRDPNGNWVTAITVPAQATSVHIPAP